MQRQLIIDALIAQLVQISIANGFETDIGANVRSSYEYDFDDEELPLVNIFENDADVPQTFGPEWHHNCPIVIQVVAIGDIGYIRKCANDVLKAIGRDKTIGGYCDNVEPGGVEFFHEELDKTYVAASIDCTLTYLSDEWRI